jgi:6-phospho-3-hexuloisomerase
MDKVLVELQNAWSLQNKDEVENFANQLSERLFLGPIVGIGAGRMGYSLRGFIMRLAHMGALASFIGDTNIPAVNSSSTVIINSSSGETLTLKVFANQAKEAGAKLFLVTQNPLSSIGKLSDVIIEMPKLDSVQVMKTFPEQYTFILLDHITTIILPKLGIDNDLLKRNHSVFE